MPSWDKMRCWLSCSIKVHIGQTALNRQVFGDSMQRVFCCCAAGLFMNGFHDNNTALTDP